METQTLNYIWKGLSSRQKNLLILLFTNEFGISVENLASCLRVSTKTVRNDLASIETILSNVPICIRRVPGTGLLLHTEDRTCYDFLQKKSSRHRLVSLDQRKVQIAKSLLLPPPTGLTEVELEKQLFLSRSSIRNELQILSNWFSKFNLQVQKKKNRGIYLEGGELDRRRALAVLFQNAYALNEDQLSPNDFGVFINAVHLKTLQSLYPGFDSAPVKHLLTQLEAAQDFPIQEEVYITLWFSLCTAVYRLRTGHPVIIPEEKFPELYREEKQQFLAPWLLILEEGYRQKFPPAERAFFIMHLEASGILSAGKRQSWPAPIKGFSQFRDDVIRSIETVLNIGFSSDQELVTNFSHHLMCSVLRLQYGIYVKNPLLQEMKQNYSGIWAATWASSVLFEKYYNLQVTEDEIGFLAMYVGTAAKRIQQSVIACIVCNYGAGVSSLLRESIHRAVPQIVITDVLSQSQYHQLRKGCQHAAWQMVISTIPLQETSLPVVTVSGLLSEKDLRHLKKSVYQLQKAHPYEAKNSSHFETCLLKPSLVFIDHPPDEKCALLEFACAQLLKGGYITSDFLPSLLEREEKVSTEIGAGIAIPHGNPAFVRRSAILAMKLRQAIVWSKGHKVDILFVLALNIGRNEADSVKAKQFFKALATLLDDENTQKSIRAATTTEEFVRCMNSINIC